jgi:hypothetical protein
VGRRRCDGKRGEEVAAFFGADANNNVQRYNGTTGAFIDVFASGGGLDFPAFIVFTPTQATVPETSPPHGFFRRMSS